MNTRLRAFLMRCVMERKHTVCMAHYYKVKVKRSMTYIYGFKWVLWPLQVQHFTAVKSHVYLPVMLLIYFTTT